MKAWLCTALLLLWLSPTVLEAGRKVGSRKSAAKKVVKKAKEDKKSKKEPSLWSSAFSPIFGVDDETGGKFGAALQFYKKGEPGFFFGTTLVGINRIDFDVRLTDIRHWFIRSHTLLSRFTERYYGEGPDTSPHNPLLIDADKVMQRFWLLHDLTKKARAGLVYKMKLRRELDADRENKAINEDLRGVIPDETVAAVGLNFAWDGRDDRSFPTEGYYFETTYWFSPSSMSNRPEGQRGFDLIDLDFRGYYPAIKDVVFANRTSVSISTSEPGYLFRPTLGGKHYMRGYGTNRFRGAHSYVNQSELRWKMWEDYLGIVGSVDIGGVVDRGRTKIHASQHIGLRIGVPPSYKWKIRAEYGHGSDQELFIIHINETF